MQSAEGYSGGFTCFYLRHLFYTDAVGNDTILIVAASIAAIAKEKTWRLSQL